MKYVIYVLKDKAPRADVLSWEFMLWLGERFNYKYITILEANSPSHALELYKEEKENPAIQKQENTEDNPEIRLPTLNLEDLEMLAIKEAIRLSNYVQADAAKLLGVHKRVLHYKLHNTDCYKKLLKEINAAKE